MEIHAERADAESDPDEVADDDEAADEATDVAADVEAEAEADADVVAEDADADADLAAEDDDAEQAPTEVEEPAAELAPALSGLPMRPTRPFEAVGVDAGHTNGHANGNGNGMGNGYADDLTSRFAVPVNGSGNASSNGSGNGSLNGSARTPASMEEDETPIFRSLRSNWLSADSGERPWADSEVDAGWEAADRVEAAPPTRRTEAGLPMRRPGNRLVPGGADDRRPSRPCRDPEAIRARLAAHAAGVSRGRRSATGPTDTTAQEVTPHDRHVRFGSPVPNRTSASSTGWSPSSSTRSRTPPTRSWSRPTAC